MKLVALALATTLGIGGAALAEPEAPRGQDHHRLLERFDRDHDGRLEPQERRRAIRTLRRIARRLAMHERRLQNLAGRQRGMIGRLDRNGDGVLGPDELPRRRGPEMLRRFDSNHDGAISPEEIQQGRARNKVRRFDRNGDGVVGPGEMPTGATRTLRPLDRNGDGWVDDADQQ